MVRALDATSVSAFVAAVVVFPFVAVGWLRNIRRTPDQRVFPICGVILFGVLIGIAMCTASTCQSLAHARVLEALDRCTPATSTVLIDKREVSDSGEILHTLKELRDVPAHHSSPTARISVDIRGPQDLSLVLARDSGDPREYSVFYPTYWITRYNEIGRLKTAIFDGYPHRSNQAMQPTAGRRTLKFSVTPASTPVATRALASGG